MEYSKPVIVAQNNADGIFAASCSGPHSNCHGGSMNSGVSCKNCSTAK
jgi:putative lipase involved disintegration of autophagic bodies